MNNPVVNFGKVTFAAGFSAVATTANLQSGHGARLAPAAAEGSFYLVVWDWTAYRDPADDPLVEIVLVSSVVTDTLTFSRAKQGTNASAHNVVGHIYKGIIAYTKNDHDTRPFLVVDVLDGTTNYKRVVIAGVDANTIYHPAWELNPDANNANAFSQPMGALYISEKGAGYVDVRANGDQGGLNRRIVLTVQKVVS